MAASDNPNRKPARARLFLAGVLAAVLAVALSTHRAAEAVDWQGRDLMLRLRGERRTNARVAVIAIADSTLEAWPEPMLFWGPHYAAILKQARNGGAKWIGFDVIPTVSADEWLIAHFPAAAEKPEDLPDRQFQKALLGGKAALSYTAERKPLPQFSELPPLDGNLGFTDVTFPDEGIIRRVRLKRDDETSLIALLAMRALDAGPDMRPASDEMWVNYIGRPGSVRTIPAERLANGTLSADEKDALRGAVLLVGPTFSGSNDFHQGPGGQWYPGVEIQAHALATLLDARTLRVPDPLRSAAALLVSGIVLAALGAWLQSGMKAVVFAASAVGWIAAAIGAARSDLLLPLVGPILVLNLVPVVQAIWSGREEGRRRRRVEALFGEHVSATVARRLLEGPPVPVDGERRTITVLFADIRGFTALSEKAPPEQVVHLLNETLSALSDCVLAAEGTLDKYVGDCVMAFWNAPSDQPDHAARAIRAALAMQEAIAKLNVSLEAKGLPEIAVRVGINTGPAVVGSIGGEAMRDYTVIGNTVNLASRLESANKELGTAILVGEATYKAAGEVEVTAREHSLAIRGVEAAVSAYSLSIPTQRL